HPPPCATNYTLSLHDALPIYAYDSLEPSAEAGVRAAVAGRLMLKRGHGKLAFGELRDGTGDIQLMCQLDVLGSDGLALFQDLDRSEEHTSELQSRFDLVCRLL